MLIPFAEQRRRDNASERMRRINAERTRTAKAALQRELASLRAWKAHHLEPITSRSGTADEVFARRKARFITFLCPCGARDYDAVLISLVVRSHSMRQVVSFPSLLHQTPQPRITRPQPHLNSDSDSRSKR